MPPQLVVCTCQSSGCGSSSFKNKFNQIQPGKLVSVQVRSTHMKHDRQAPVIHQSATNEVPSRIHAAKQSLFLMACTMASFLHLSCGLSRLSSGRVLKMLQVMLQAAFHLGVMVAQAGFRSPQPSPLSTPLDVRHAISSLSLEPTIIRTVCCPKCYHKYNLDELPEICLQREVRKSRKCGQTLWTTRSTRGGPKRVPERLYSTQDLTSWLEFFLSRPEIEDLIDQSYTHIPTPEKMTSIRDSPAWQSLGDFTTTKHNLTFSYFIDWYNPFGNKRSGKAVSCGCIMMFCLNLPYELQHLTENTFFVGITPPPNEPSVVTITELADPVIDQLVELYTGKLIRTYHYPQGIWKRLAVLPAIGDLLAIRKALGFAGVTAKNFCSFCTLKSSEMESLAIDSWKPREGIQVRIHATAWKNAKTKKLRQEIFDAHGVRWSSLHRLPYRDHVRHTVLGVMHNWIEGILQHHARVKWGFGQIAKGEAEDEDDEPSTPPPSPRLANSLDYSSVLDVEMDEELLQLEEEGHTFQDTPSHSHRTRPCASFMQLDDVDNDGDVDMDFQPDEESDSEGSSVSEEQPSFNYTSTFGAEALQEVRTCIANAMVPTWLARPPRNLGQKSHGKLKADQWLVLFTVYLPLILPELWSKLRGRGAARNRLLLENFAHLIACTNIICSHSVTNAAADRYVELYVHYRKSSAKLFPHARSRPNHHMAMHNGDLMKFWGPLMKLSEFPYEQHNGTLQKVPTNSHLWELDLTMLRQICRRGRFLALLQGNNGLGSSFVNILLPERREEVETAAKGQVRLPADVYEAILDLLNAEIHSATQRLRHFINIPHPINATVLSPSAIPLNHIKHKTRAYSTHCLHAGNSSIEFRDNGGEHATGFIQQMWDLKGQGTFLLVSTHLRLSAEDALRSPFRLYPELRGDIVYAEVVDREHWTVIESSRIEGHVAYYSRPAGTFGISSTTLVLVTALHRNRP